MRLGLALILLLVSTVSHADGYLFKDGRFSVGKVTVLQLTPEQKQVIALYRKCNVNNYTPYIFNLTPQQSTVLLKESGRKPKRFAIFESVAGDNGADLEFNVINRFSHESFEIPHNLLTTEKGLRDWEINIIGWEPSPLATATQAQLKSGICPDKLVKPPTLFKRDVQSAPLNSSDKH